MYSKTTLIALATILLANVGQAKEFRSVDVFSPLDLSTVSNNLFKVEAETNFATIQGPFATVMNLDTIRDFKKNDDKKPENKLDEKSLTSALKPPVGVIRRNILRQNAKQLDTVFSAAEADSDVVPLLTFDLFDDVHLKVIINNVAKMKDGSTSVSGYVQGMPGSFASLTKKDSSVFGTIKTYDRVYELNPTTKTFAPIDLGGGNGISAGAVFDAMDGGPQQSNTVIDEANPSFPGFEEPPTKKPPPKPKTGAAEDINPTAFDATIGEDPTKPSPPASINFAVFYTRAAVDGAGGADAINALINSAVGSLRESFLASEINLTVSVSFTGLLEYNETGNIESDRDALQAHTDVSFAQLPALKTAAKANIVGLIVENAGVYCGISYIPEEPGLNYADFAYIVVARKCAVNNLSFAHEVGHVLGARHDMYVDPTEGKPFLRNHGIIFRCGPQYCRDIMAYGNYCNDMLHTACTRVALWSGKVWDAGQLVPENPNDVNEDTQRALRIFGPIVSGYK